MIVRAASGNNLRVTDLSLARPGLIEASVAAPEGTGARARALVDEHFDFVWRLLRRLGVPQADTDDTAQQVFIIGAGRLADIPSGGERAFLYGTALRTAATVRRNLRRRERWLETAPADAVSGERTPDEHLERREALFFLDHVLHQLEDELRDVFVLSEIEELTAPEVARLLGIPAGTVASRLWRARHDFGAKLKRLRTQRLREP